MPPRQAIGSEHNRRARCARLLAAAAALALGGGCGYALVGKGVNVDPSIRRIGVPLFQDRTGKPGLDHKITQRVVEELLRRGRFDVVPQATGVDALVSGEVLSYAPRPLGLSTSAGEQLTQATRYAIVLTARVRYTKAGVDEPLWSSEAYSVTEEYDLGDAATFFDREDQAIDRLAAAFARNLVAEMLEAF